MAASCCCSSLVRVPSCAVLPPKRPAFTLRAHPAVRAGAKVQNVRCSSVQGVPHGVANIRKAIALTASSMLLTLPAIAEDAAEAADPGALATAGKWAVILIVADVITATVLGKSAFDFLKKGGEGGGGGGDWKEKLADEMMAKMEEKKKKEAGGDKKE